MSPGAKPKSGSVGTTLKVLTASRTSTVHSPEHTHKEYHSERVAPQGSVSSQTTPTIPSTQCVPTQPASSSTISSSPSTGCIPRVHYLLTTELDLNGAQNAEAASVHLINTSCNSQ